MNALDPLANATRSADQVLAREAFSLSDGLNTFTAIAEDGYGRRDTNTVSVNLPASVTVLYDLNGNMRTNGSEVLIWDDENRLVTNYVAEAWKGEFVYDGKHRRRVQRDYAWSGSGLTLTNETRFIYDGNVPIQHRDANNLPVLTLTRGRDLSGSLQGAGGIGGLLARSEMSNPQSLHAYYHADGNGNITALINTNQLIGARYHYDSFGNTLSLSGPLAEANLYRFSSKEWHPNSVKVSVPAIVEYGLTTEKASGRSIDNFVSACSRSTASPAWLTRRGRQHTVTLPAGSCGPKTARGAMTP